MLKQSIFRVLPGSGIGKNKSASGREGVSAARHVGMALLLWQHMTLILYSWAGGGRNALFLMLLTMPLLALLVFSPLYVMDGDITETLLPLADAIAMADGTKALSLAQAPLGALILGFAHQLTSHAGHALLLAQVISAVAFVLFIACVGSSRLPIIVNGMIGASGVALIGVYAMSAVPGLCVAALIMVCLMPATGNSPVRAVIDGGMVAFLVIALTLTDPALGLGAVVMSVLAAFCAGSLRGYIFIVSAITLVVSGIVLWIAVLGDISSAHQITELLFKRLYEADTILRTVIAGVRDLGISTVSGQLMLLITACLGLLWAVSSVLGPLNMIRMLVVGGALFLMRSTGFGPVGAYCVGPMVIALAVSSAAAPGYRLIYQVRTKLAWRTAAVPAFATFAMLAIAVMVPTTIMIDHFKQAKVRQAELNMLAAHQWSLEDRLLVMSTTSFLKNRALLSSVQGAHNVTPSVIDMANTPLKATAILSPVDLGCFFARERKCYGDGVSAARHVGKVLVPVNRTDFYDSAWGTFILKSQAILYSEFQYADSIDGFEIWNRRSRPVTNERKR